jgi:hypothetical protein
MSLFSQIMSLFSMSRTVICRHEFVFECIRHINCTSSDTGLNHKLLLSLIECLGVKKIHNVGPLSESVL